MEGYIKLYRKLKEWQWYKNSEMVHLFIHLLLNANHKEGEWQGIKVCRGQVITGRKNLAQTTGLSEQSIRTCIKRLKSTNEITTKSTNKFTVITICNYELYQNRNELSNQNTDKQANQQSTSSQPATNQQLTINKNVKNDNNVENGYNFLSQKVRPHFKEFIKQQRKPIDEVRLNALLEHLNDIAATDELKIGVIKQAIRGGHPDFRPLPESDEDYEYEVADESANENQGKTETKEPPANSAPLAPVDAESVPNKTIEVETKKPKVIMTSPSRQEIIEYLKHYGYVEGHWIIDEMTYDHILEQYSKAQEKNRPFDWQKCARAYWRKRMREKY